jgi:CRP-like cAMP-binding protein
MEKYFPVLRDCPLFAGTDEADLPALLKCLSPVLRAFEKNAQILVMGGTAASAGIVLSGGVRVVREDFWGNRNILAHIPPSGLFGEAFSCAGVDRLPVGVTAAEKSEVLFIDCKRIAAVCSAACAFHTGLVRNLLAVLARKNVALTQKMEHLTRRSTREKLLSYLSEQAERAGGALFSIPFNRQELADYLSVDRSAMSAELSRMRDERLLRCRRNHFELLRRM